MRQDPGALRPAELTKWPDRCFGFRTAEEALHLAKRVLVRLGHLGDHVGRWSRVAW